MHCSSPGPTLSPRTSIWAGSGRRPSGSLNRRFSPSSIPTRCHRTCAGQVIARLDQIKAELPDVFYVQNDPNYPLNFAAIPYPGSSATGTYGPVLLPLGAGVFNDPQAVNGTPSYGGYPNLPYPYLVDPTTGVVTLIVPSSSPASTGIFGASYTAAAGIYKGLFDAVQRNNPGIGSPTPRNAGFDGVDTNSDPNGLVDEIKENDMGLPPGTISGPMLALLKNHNHKTARAEMLYALLIEGQGPYGSAFTRDDFSDSEVKDTDGDGLWEFVDAWGEPLQFFRWPIFYVSDSQTKGANLYQTQSTIGGISISIEQRAQDTLDPNQTLVDPAWWAAANNATPSVLMPPSVPFGSTNAPLSGGAFFVQSAFHSLTDPNAPGVKAGGTTLQGATWDRGSSGTAYWPRRAFYSRHLIISGGPDKVPGVPILDPNYMNALVAVGAADGLTISAYAGETIPQGGGLGAGLPTHIALDIQIENQAAQATPARSDALSYSFGAVYSYGGALNQVTDVLTRAIQNAGNDDISSQDTTGGSGGALQ